MALTQPHTAADAAGLLEAAADQLRAKADDLPQAGRANRADIAERLRWVSQAAQAFLSSENPELGGTATGIDVALVHALRHQLLQADDPEVSDPASLLAALRALDRVFSWLTGDDPEDLRTRLSRPDAFDLLVEVAHDLRSPLTSILFLSETLRSGHSGPLSDHQRSQLGLIYSAALGLVSVASDVVDLARKEEGLLDEEPEPYAIDEILGHVATMVRPMAEEKGLDLIVTVPQYGRGYGLPTALSRVILNLTTNGLKFTDSGFVEIGAKRSGHRQWEFWVRDTGPGIPAERQETLFEPFKKRAAGKGHFFSGSGVGLSIARRLVLAMGSELQLETEPNWGCRFSFRVDAHPMD